jgi:hypothetical protein
MANLSVHLTGVSLRFTPEGDLIVMDMKAIQIAI